MSESETRGRFIRSVPLTLVVTLLLQGATIVWWASARDREDAFTETRLTHLESGLAHTQDVGSVLLERLARIEERVNAQIATLNRIEKRLEKTP